jgi:K(+)-stimulated pyrophosphate-energized sodium pump
MYVGDESTVLGFVFLCCIIGLGFAVELIRFILKQPDAPVNVRSIADMIHRGAMTFLNKEYEVMVVFMVVIASVLFFMMESPGMALMFMVGSVCSALAGRIGMHISTRANSRTAVAAEKSLNEGLKIAFSSGVVMGMFVVSIGLLGVAVFHYIYRDPNMIFGFAFGASFIALFARVGGGIYTKAADVGADLVGKVEKGIPEDDPRNPVVIADNVGDNVGDVAGMGADLFESYVASIVAAMVMGVAFYPANPAMAVLLPLVLSAVGILCSIIGTFFVRVKEGKSIFHALNKGVFAASLAMAAASYFIINGLLGDMSVFWATLLGLIGGVIMGLSTEYYTSKNQRPTQGIAKASTTGAGTALIEGIAVGMRSTIIPLLVVGFTMMVSFNISGLYGVAIAAVGMLSTLGIMLAAETYGAVADNAAGLSEMGRLGKKTRERTEELDAIGNTTAAIGKGFAIGSAALTSVVLFIDYIHATGLKGIDASQPDVILGLLIGGLLPYVFCSLLMTSVGKAAQKMVEEARRQFHTIKGLMQGKAKPDVQKCIAISTEAALYNMALPGVLIITIPIVVGLTLGVGALGGMLVGSMVTGFLMAVFMANAGGAWDNAKKYIEAGNFGGKGSDAHKAAVVGDTVGDPFKDTAGPSLNILMKLMSIVSIVFVPLFL